MALKFRRGTTAQKSGSLAFGEPYVNTTLGTLQIGGDSADITLSAVGTGSNLLINDITASGNVSVAGDVTVGGKLTIGDNTSDTVTVVASLSSSLIPETANTYDLGSAQKFWKDLYISTGSIKFVDNSGTVVGTLSGNASGDLKITGELSGSTIAGLGNASEFSASVAYRVVNLERDMFNVTASVQAINIWTSSVATTTGLTNLSSSIYQTDSTQSNNITTAQNSADGAFASASAYSASAATTYAKLAVANTFTGNQTITGSLTATTTVNAASALINGYLEIKTGTDVNSVKIGRNTGGSATRTVAIGYGSAGGAGSYNVAVGDQAGQQLAGSNNVVIGATSLNATINASSNTVVGSNTGNTVALGNTNTLIGAGISLGVGSATNTIIGASVSQSVLTDNIILANGSGVIKFWYNGTDNILNNNSVVSGSLTVTGSISAGGDIVAYSTSDRRHKNNIVLISDALSKVTKLNGVTWEWNDDVDAVTKQSPKTGLIAQEVQEVLPEVVKERGDGFLALDYSKTIGLLVEAIKEQQTQIHSLTLEIEKLKKNNSL